MVVIRPVWAIHLCLLGVNVICKDDTPPLMFKGKTNQTNASEELRTFKRNRVLRTLNREPVRSLREPFKREKGSWFYPVCSKN